MPAIIKSHDSVSSGTLQSQCIAASAGNGAKSTITLTMMNIPADFFIIVVYTNYY